MGFDGRGGGGFKGGRGGGGGFRGGDRGGGGGFRGGDRGGGFRGGDKGGFKSPRQEFHGDDKLIDMGEVLHPSEDLLICKSVNPKIPKFNSSIYQEGGSEIGNVDEIFGPINEVMFSIKLGQGFVPTSFQKGSKVMIYSSQLLPFEMFTEPEKKAKGSGGGRGGGRGGRGGGGRGGGGRGGGGRGGGRGGGGDRRGGGGDRRGGGGGGFRGGRGGGGGGGGKGGAFGSPRGPIKKF